MVALRQQIEDMAGPGDAAVGAGAAWSATRPPSRAREAGGQVDPERGPLFGTNARPHAPSYSAERSTAPQRRQHDAVRTPSIGGAGSAVKSSGRGLGVEVIPPTPPGYWDVEFRS